MKIVDVSIGDKDFKIPVWGMSKQLENHHVVMPVLKEPLVNALALATDQGANEAIFFAAVADGIMQALTEINLLKFSTILLDGVVIRSKEGGFIPATIENLEANGCDISTIYILCVNVIKENYHSLLKKDLLDSLMPWMDSLDNPQDKEDSSNE